MKKQTTHFFSLFCLALCFFTFIFSTQAQEKSNAHMVWKITSEEGKTGYLLGSVHMAKPELFPLDSIYYEVFDKADIIGFEVNLDSLLIETQALLPKYGLYPTGESLKDHLSEETFKKLEDYMSSFGVPIVTMLQMKPWIIASSFSALELQKSGYSIEGIDQHFFNKAKDKNKKIIGLETTEFQMKIFAEMPEKEQIDFLEYSLENAKESVESIDEIMRFWEIGDAENLHQLMEGGMEEFSHEVYEDIIINRNKNWIPKIQQLMQDHTPLIIVGVGHLVGENSVNDLLTKEGYQVKQL